MRTASRAAPLLMMKWRRFKINVAKMTAAAPAPAESMLTAAIWLAPAKTMTDIVTVWPGVSPL